MRAEQKSIDNETFVRSWETNKTAHQVADELGINYHVATQKAQRLRARGVKLKRGKGGRGRQPMESSEVAHLNAIIRELKEGRKHA